MNTIHIEIGGCSGGIKPVDYLTEMLKILQKSENKEIVKWAKNYKISTDDFFTRFDDLSYFLNVTPDIENDLKNFFGIQLKNLYYSGLIRYASW